MNGTVVGYDPGGNGSHGLAALRIREGRATEAKTVTLSTAECVIRRMEEELDTIIGLGVDTLSYWSTGPSGWRDADIWLRKNYPLVRNSIVAPNGLYGSMGLNGMSVLITSRSRYGELLPITETHPKVLYAALSGERYDYTTAAGEMIERLSQWLGLQLPTRNEHKWDAAISALAALKGISGDWQRDLIPQSHRGDSRLVFPCGPVNYWWPD